MIKHVSDEEMQLRQTLAQTVKELRMVVAAIEVELGNQEAAPRKWVGLSKEEAEQMADECAGKYPFHIAYSMAVEAKLKEKNCD